MSDLERHQMLSEERSASCMSFSSSLSKYYDAEILPQRNDIMEGGARSIANASTQQDYNENTRHVKGGLSDKQRDETTNGAINVTESGPCTEQIRSAIVKRHLVIKDSIEDLSSSVPRSPQFIHPAITSGLSRPCGATMCKNSPSLSLRLPPQLSPSGVSDSTLQEEHQVTPKHGTLPQVKTDPVSECIQPSIVASKPLYTASSLPKIAQSPEPSVYNSNSNCKRSSLKLRTVNAAPQLNRKTSNSSTVSAPISRPLSPFTGAGFLRRLTSNIGTRRTSNGLGSLTPPSAPAAITSFGPTVQDEVDEAMKQMLAQGDQRKVNLIDGSEHQLKLDRTTRTQRGGRSLINLLSKRVDGQWLH